MGTFESIISDLEVGTYYIRAYVTDSFRTAYSEQLTYGMTGNDGSACPAAETVSDIDGNTYNTVQIGNQCWMKENLRTTRYADGMAATYYNNGVDSAEYGYMYTWDNVMHGEPSSSSNPSGVRGICPTGWHVPSDAEWTELEEYVGNHSLYLCSSSYSGGYSIAKSLASTHGWNSYNSYSSGYPCFVGYMKPLLSS